MTPEQHNKYLGIAHLVFGALVLLIILGFVSMFGVIFMAIANEPVRPGQAPPPPAGFFLAVAGFMVAFYGAFLAPSFIAGYALLKRKRWAKIAAIIAGVVSAMFAPFGTALSVYTFWFLFSEPGRLLYDTPSQLPPGPPLFGADQDASRREFQPPDYQRPPDWR